MATLLIGPRCNRRVTCDASPSNDRSESAIVANPLNPYNLVGVSKRFTNTMTYAFSLATYATFDGGQSWVEGVDAATGLPLQLQPNWGGISDPAVAWDDVGNVFLIALPWLKGFLPAGHTLGLASYQSSDGGRTWSPPNLFHTAAPGIDDKQSAAGDGNPGSPFHGNVYAVWNGPGGLNFARTTDHGATWKGTGAAPPGSVLDPNGAFADVFVGPDGTVYVVYFEITTPPAGPDVTFVKSTDGGNSFSAPATVASGITLIPYTLPGGTFRVESFATGCTGASSNDVVVAWPDYRTGVSRIYYARSTNGGSTWTKPAELLTGAVASAPNQHEIQPQLAATPDGVIGCAFYEFGPKSPSATTSLIDVILAASDTRGRTFADRATVTDQPWDPAVDAPWAEGNPSVTFIGDYFGLAASRLGFFPLWVDTRTGVQEMFTSRLAVSPCDLYIRDSSADVGMVASPGNHWEAPDLVVRRQPDGSMNFVNQDLLRDGKTDHYVYARVTSTGPNPGRNVTVAVTVGNYPSLIGLPSSEFRYPQDWYPGDWDTALQARHLYLGETPAVATMPVGAVQILGPIVWKAADIPPEISWHPCLLAEVRADNDDSAGGVNGCPIDVYPGTCDYGNYFWGNNNVCQRNLSYVTVPPFQQTGVEFPFLVGSPLGRAGLVEVIVHKGPHLAEVPMRVRTVRLAGRQEDEMAVSAGILNLERRLAERLGGSSTLVAKRETGDPVPDVPDEESCFGGERVGRVWHLTHPRGAVVFRRRRGEVRLLVLSFQTPPTLEPGLRPQVRIFQRNDQRVITGSVILELDVRHAEGVD